MTLANRPPSGAAPGQPWTPGATAKGVTCPACGLANEPGARTCRNCGLPIASAEDPVRGVAPGRVDLPKVRRSGVSATVGFVMVIALLLVGGSLAVSGGGGLLSGGGRFFGAEVSPSPTPAPSVVPGIAVVTDGNDANDTTDEPQIRAKGTSFDYTCNSDAIKDLSKRRWFLSDVVGALRTEEDGTRYDEIYWKLSQQGNKKNKKATKVTMQWSTPQELRKRFGIQNIGGDRALLITFDGPVSIAANQTIEREQFDDEGIDQVRRVQMFEANGKVRTVVGLNQESCARMSSNGWKKDSKRQNVRIELDIERIYAQ